MHVLVCMDVLDQGQQSCFLLLCLGTITAVCLCRPEGFYKKEPRDGTPRSQNPLCHLFCLLFLLYVRWLLFIFTHLLYPLLCSNLYPLSPLSPLSFFCVSLLQGDCRTREEALILGVELCDNGFMHHGMALFTTWDFDWGNQMFYPAVEKLWNPHPDWLIESGMLCGNLRGHLAFSILL